MSLFHRPRLVLTVKALKPEELRREKQVRQENPEVERLLSQFGIGVRAPKSKRETRR